MLGVVWRILAHGCESRPKTALNPSRLTSLAVSSVPLQSLLFLFAGPNRSLPLGCRGFRDARPGRRAGCSQAFRGSTSGRRRKVYLTWLGDASFASRVDRIAFGEFGPEPADRPRQDCPQVHMVHLRSTSFWFWILRERPGRLHED